MKQVNPDKLDPRSVRGIFIGYPKDSYEYSFYVPSEQRVVISRHVVFLEKEFILNGDSGSSFDLDDVEDDEVIEDEHEESVEHTHQETQELRRSGRIRQAPIRYGYLIEQDDDHVIENDEPTTYKEVLSSEDKIKWLHAMKIEMDSMYLSGSFKRR